MLKHVRNASTPLIKGSSIFLTGYQISCQREIWMHFFLLQHESMLLLWMRCGRTLPFRKHTREGKNCIIFLLYLNISQIRYTSSISTLALFIYKQLKAVHVLFVQLHRMPFFSSFSHLVSGVFEMTINQIRYIMFFFVPNVSLSYIYKTTAILPGSSPNHVYSDSVSFVLVPVHIWKTPWIVNPKRKPRIMRWHQYLCQSLTQTSGHYNFVDGRVEKRNMNAKLSMQSGHNLTR